MGKDTIQSSPVVRPGPGTTLCSGSVWESISTLWTLGTSWEDLALFFACWGFCELLNTLFYFLLVACGILVPWPEIKYTLPC